MGDYLFSIDLNPPLASNHAGSCSRVCREYYENHIMWKAASMVEANKALIVNLDFYTGWKVGDSGMKDVGMEKV